MNRLLLFFLTAGYRLTGKPLTLADLKMEEFRPAMATPFGSVPEPSAPPPLPVPTTEGPTVLEVVRDAFFRLAREDVRDAFDGSHTPDGIPWAPPKGRLRPAPGRQPPGGRRLLVRTGKLREAALNPAAWFNPRLVPPSRWEIDIPLPFYGPIHQNGSGRIPQRRFIGYSPATLVKTYDAARQAAEGRGSLRHVAASVMGGA